jgi:preprotein translocase subunit SecE
MENTNIPNSNSRSKLDTFLWILALILIATGVFANYYFNEVAWALRFVGWIFLIGAVFGLLAITVTGKSFLVFAKNARIELLKVVWPTRDEVVKITMVVAALVLVASVVLWGIDSVLLWLVGLLTKSLV